MNEPPLPLTRQLIMDVNDFYDIKVRVQQILLDEEDLAKEVVKELSDLKTVLNSISHPDV